MPTYDYECDACGHAFELFQPITARAIRKCPACGKATAKRLIGAGGGVIFRGSGFYQTDYRSDGYRQKAKAEKEGGSASASPSKTDEAKKPQADAPKAAKPGGTPTKKPDA
ncbi:MAG: zinc ribbon domain-containing protein [Phycisphaerae bacterium]|nr:zinc ribbon domain-containing protein [Phycisphaerae bacterium]